MHYTVVFENLRFRPSTLKWVASVVKNLEPLVSRPREQETTGSRDENAKLQVSDRAWVLKYQLECEKVQWLQTHCGQAWISLGKSLYKDICFVSTVEIQTLHVQELPYMNVFCECILKKIEPTQEHFKYTARKLMLLKSVLLMTYSSRKLSNKKVITKACNVWRQIACSFQVYGRTTHHNFCAKSTWKPLFWISRLFSPDQHWRHNMSLPTIFLTALRR